jgi:DNA-directed RNA polymerase beta subunit
VFKALNVEKRDMIDAVRTRDERIVRSLNHQYDEFDDAISAIANLLPAKTLIKKEGDDEPDKRAYVKSILSKELFYHVGLLDEKKSSVHLAYILNRLIRVSTGSLAQDDKYNLSHKRLETTGPLVAFIFNGLFKQYVKVLSTQLVEKKNADALTTMAAINIISFGMASCFMASNWTTQKSQNAYSREGVSQVLSVQNYGARISHLRRIMLPNGVKGKNSSARLLHSSHFSFICPFETPEGDRVGLVSNLALTVDVTNAVPIHEVRETIADCFDTSFGGKYLVLINGEIVGSCLNAYSFLDAFDKYRRSDSLDSTVSVAWLWHADEIHVWSDEGRLIRPVIRCDVGVGIKSFEDGLQSGAIVFRDVLELEQAVVAMDASDLKRNKCDYLEICPAGTMMSVMASVIPFSNHSQSPRNAYQASMGKQAIGIPCQSYQYRYDTTMHVLNYPQQPVTKSRMVNIIKFNEMSHGAMPIVAIMTFCGFNQEDSVILNKSSIDRGLFVCTTYNTLLGEERKRGNNDFESICLPKLVYRKHDVNYSYLDENGIIKADTRVMLNAGDAIVGKTQNQMVKKEDGSRSLETRDATIVIKAGEQGYVDSVYDAINSDGVRVVKVRIRTCRIPEIGDKFASSTAQKGTCGMIFAQEDLPFDADGITPDLIINPHAIPSRMTINMLIEQCLNMVGCRTGKFQDATAFAHSSIEDEVSAKMRAAGFSDYKTQLYSGFTGERLPSKTFMAPAFYQRLKHMVSDKIHARMSGPLDLLTHQPVAGRSREGGLRYGNMECDATVASGASYMVKEFMFEQSDKYQLSICPSCGQIPLDRDMCQTCCDETEKKNTPYATKLFYQLLIGSGVKVSIK